MRRVGRNAGIARLDDPSSSSVRWAVLVFFKRRAHLRQDWWVSVICCPILLKCHPQKAELIHAEDLLQFRFMHELTSFIQNQQNQFLCILLWLLVRVSCIEVPHKIAKLFTWKERVAQSITFADCVRPLQICRAEISAIRRRSTNSFWQCVSPRDKSKLQNKLQNNAV